MDISSPNLFSNNETSQRLSGAP